MILSRLSSASLSTRLSGRYRHLSSRSTRSSTMAAAAPTIVYVKGDPATKTLGDCPFCHRALLTFEAKKIPHTLEYIDFDHKPAWLQDVSGGKVPVIKEDGLPYMPDSDVIVVHLEDKYPEPSMKSSVLPEIGAKLFPAFRGYLMGPETEQADKAAQLLAELQAINKYLEAHKSEGPLFGGHRLNATDAAVAPKLYHCIVALRHFKGWELPQELQAVHRYMDAVKQLPEWKATDYGEDMIIKGWKRHLTHH